MKLVITRSREQLDNQRTPRNADMKQGKPTESGDLPAEPSTKLVDCTAHSTDLCTKDEHVTPDTDVDTIAEENNEQNNSNDILCFPEITAAPLKDHLDSAVKQNRSSTATDDKEISVSMDCPTKQDSSNDRSATSEEGSEPSHKPVESDTSTKQSKELDSATPSTDCQSKQEDSDTSKCQLNNCCILYSTISDLHCQFSFYCDSVPLQIPRAVLLKLLTSLPTLSTRQVILPTLTVRLNRTV